MKSKRIGFELVRCPEHEGKFEFRQIRVDRLGRYPYVLSCLTLGEVEALQLEFTACVVNATMPAVEEFDGA